MNKIFRYIFSGGTGAITNLGLLFILTHYAGFHYLASGIIAFSCAVVVSFIMQKKWTFADHSTDSTHRKFTIFAAMALANLCINTSLLYFFTEVFHFFYLVSQVLASGIVALWSYFLYARLFVHASVIVYDVQHEKDND